MYQARRYNDVPLGLGFGGLQIFQTVVEKKMSTKGNFQKFIIVATQRTGSTFLWRYLDTHPSIEGYGEVFSRKRKLDSYFSFLQSSFTRRVRHHLDRKGSVANYLEYLYQSGSGSARAICFKLMYSHIFPELREWIDENYVKRVHLIRENYLKIIVSREVKKTGAVSNARPGDEVALTTIRLRTDNLISRLNQLAVEVEQERQQISGKPHIEICYERLCDDLESSIRDILDFIEVPWSKAMKVPMKKVNPDRLDQILENYEEVAEVLRGTRYELFLK